jgi:anti-sigma factor RsiW
LEEHLSGCHRCRAELLLQNKILDALTEEMPYGLAADFTQRVSEKALDIRPRERKPLLAQVWPQLVPAFAFAVGVAVLVFLGDDLVRVLSSVAGPATGPVAGPIASFVDAVTGLFSGAADFPQEYIPWLDRLSPALLNAIFATLLGSVPAVWGFHRVHAFLRD